MPTLAHRSCEVVRVSPDASALYRGVPLPGTVTMATTAFSMVSLMIDGALPRSVTEATTRQTERAYGSRSRIFLHHAVDGDVFVRNPHPTA